MCSQRFEVVLVVWVIAGEKLQGLAEPAEFVGVGHDGGSAVHGGAVVELVGAFVVAGQPDRDPDVTWPATNSTT